MKQQGPKQRAEAPRSSTAKATTAAPKAASAAAGHRYAGAAAARSPGAPTPPASAAAAPLSDLSAQAQQLHSQHGAQIEQGAQQAGVPQQALAAVLLAERGYLPRAAPGQSEALPIRFEPYVFFQLTGRWLAATHRDQGAEQRVFDQACALDPAAAHHSLRMGLAQISGAESAAAGYADAQSMKAALTGDPVAQVAALVALAVAPGPLQQGLAAENWQQVAQLRAGPGYGALGYDQALAAGALAYKSALRHGGGDDDEPKKRKRS